MENQQATLSPNPAAREAQISMQQSGEQARTFVPSGFAPNGHRRTPWTLAEQREILGRGESVLWNNFIISRPENLPSEAVMALGDPEKEAVAKQNLRAEIERKMAELTALEDGTLVIPTAAPGVGPGISQPAQQTQPRVVVEANPHGLSADGERSLKEAQRQALLNSQRVAEPSAP